jgi:hypothetical protein
MPPREPKSMVPFAACEGFYAAIVYVIAVLGGVAALLFLSDVWTRGLWSALCFAILVLAFLRYAQSKRRSTDGFVVSFSRTDTTIVCDIFIQTARVSLVSVLVDLVGNQKVDLLFNNNDPTWYQGRLTLVVLALGFFLIFPIVYGYLVQAALEIDRQKT